MDENDAGFFEGRVVLRTASAMDAGAVSILLEISYPRLLANSYDINTLERALPYLVKPNPMLLASGTYYVAEVEPGKLVGCGGWTPEKPGSGEVVKSEGHVRQFAVHPDWIRRGIGTGLLTRCIIDAKSVGIQNFYCVSTLNAESFYRASGFQTIGSIDVRIGKTIVFPAVLMEREVL